jgi:hypothetical protein
MAAINQSYFWNELSRNIAKYHEHHAAQKFQKV